jgi:transposase-like protein
MFLIFSPGEPNLSALQSRLRSAMLEHMAKPSTLRSVMENYGTEQACVDRLTRILWPIRVTCRKCGRTCPGFNAPGSSGKSRHLYQCSACRIQFSATSETLFRQSHVPLRDWFLAVYFLGVSRGRLPATELQRILGVSYETAFSMKRRLAKASGRDKKWLAKLLDTGGSAPSA